MKHQLPHHELIARAVIIQHNSLLVNRNVNAKTGENYCALPGGHVDEGESCVEAVARELKEELNAQVSVDDLCFVAESVYAGRHDWDGRRQEVVLYFWATLISELQGDGAKIFSPESDKNFAWLPLNQIKATNVLPLSFKNWLLQKIEVETSFISAPQTTSTQSESTSLQPPIASLQPPIASLSLYDFHDATKPIDTSSTRQSSTR